MQKIITGIVETPRGRTLKYDFDPLLGCCKLNKVMPSGMVFPFDFGFIPGTVGGDGDPVDILIISELETFSGCAIDCRIIGGIKASQQERNGERMRNDRMIAIADVSKQYAAVNKLADLPKGMLDELESFFKNYNDQAGKVFEPLKRLTAKQAMNIIEKAKTESTKDTFVQLFIPQDNPSGSRYAPSKFAKLNAELKDKFGGFIVYSRLPAKDIREAEQGDTISKDMLVYEVLTHASEGKYWTELKSRLEKQFDQNEIMVLLTKVSKI